MGCVADQVGVGEKTFPGAKCVWTTGPNLTVGPEISIDDYHTFKTSQNLRIKDNTLHTMNGVYIGFLARQIGLQDRWEEHPKAIGTVLDADGVLMTMGDIPTPVPD